MTVGEKIRSIRKEKGISQAELAEKSSLAEITIRQYEANNRNPKIENIQSIAIALEVPVERLIPTNKNCLPGESRKQKCQIIADHYGFRKQSMMMIEECSELQQSICKWKREHRYVKNTETYHCKERTAIIDELADVIIMAKQLSYLLSAEDEVSEQIEFKLDRQLRRMGVENAD